MENLGERLEQANEWSVAIETILALVSNVLKHPGDPKYFKINMSNPVFHRRVGHLEGALKVLVGLGFREGDSEGSLELPIDTDLLVLEARRLELEVGLARLNARIKNWTSTKKVKVETQMPAQTTEQKASKTASSSKQSGDAKGSTIGTAQSANVAPAVNNAAMAAANAAAAAEAQKALTVLKEERNKRLKAETALNHQKDFVKELQTMISTLQANKGKDNSLRHELALSRLINDDYSGTTMRPFQSGSDATAASSPSRTRSKKGSTENDINVAEEKYLDTVLISDAKCGDSILHIKDMTGFKKGSRIMIGSGLAVEERVVVKLGSLYLDYPLTYDHGVNTRIRLYNSSMKPAALQRVMNSEFMKGVLLELIVPAAEKIGEETLLSNALTKLYASRPVPQHTIYCEHSLGPIPLPNAMSSDSIGKGPSIGFSGKYGKLYGIFDKSSVCSYSIALNPVDFIVLFVQSNVMELPKRSKDLKLVLPSTISLNSLYERLNNDGGLRGAFQRIAEFHTFKSYDQLLSHYATGADKPGGAQLTWSDFVKMLNPLSEKAIEIKTKAASDLFEIINGAVDIVSITLLSMLFDLFDMDDDSFLDASDVLEAFSQLDGACCDKSALDECSSRINGRSFNDIGKFDIQTFLNLRREYCLSVNTLPAGFRLYGLLYLESLTALLSHSGRSPVLASSLQEEVVDNVLLSNIVGKGSFKSVLNSLGASMISTSEVKSLICESSAFVGNSTIGCGSWSASNGTNKQLAESSDKFVQVFCDDRRGRSLALTSSGVMHVSDIATGEYIFQQRLLWSEPLITRVVEGHERFLKWRRDSQILEYVDESTDSLKGMGGVGRDALASSSALAKFQAHIFAVLNVGEAKVFSVDDATGLVFVNSSITSASIAVYDPIALRRVYRIKSPVKLSEWLEEKTREIAANSVFDPSTMDAAILKNPHYLSGFIVELVPIATRSLIACRCANDPSGYLMEILTGDLVAKLDGHTSPLSSILYLNESCLILSGCQHGSLRVWSLNDFANVSGSGRKASSIATLEASISNAVGRTGQRNPLRTLGNYFVKKLRIAPRWCIGRITGYFDGSKYTRVLQSESHILGVEVTFDDCTVRVYSNKSLLRDVQEAKFAPEGPPNWRNPSAALDMLSNVAVFEVEQEEFSLSVARALCVPINEDLTANELRDFIETFNHSAIRETNGDQEDFMHSVVLPSFEALGISLVTNANDLWSSAKVLSVRTLCRYLLDAIADSRPHPIKSCVRHVVGPHSSSITAIQYLPSSKLVVTIDSNGTACVWDPIDNRVCTSLDFASNMHGERFVMAGCNPFSLVSSFVIGEKITGLNGAAPRIRGAVSVPIPSVDSISFPAPKSSLLASAYSADVKFKANDVSLRAFIYVLADLTYIGVPVSCFAPDFLSIDSKEALFAFAPLVCVDMKSMESSNDSSSVYESMNMIFANRSRVLRVVYVVSCLHKTTDDVIRALSQYGVLQKGSSFTPSERMEVVSFDRNQEWMHRVVDANLRNPLERGDVEIMNAYDYMLKTGVVISIEDIRVKVALDMSNDVIVIERAHIRRVIDSSLSNSGARIACGCKVEFVYHLRPLTWRHYERMLTCGCDASACESILVLADFVSPTNKVESSVILPISIGRSTRVVAAASVTSAISNSLKQRLASLCEAERAKSIGYFAASAFLRKCNYSRLANAQSQQISRAHALLMKFWGDINCTLSDIDASLLIPDNLSNSIHMCFRPLLYNTYHEGLASLVMFMNSHPASALQHPLFQHYNSMLSTSDSSLLNELSSIHRGQQHSKPWSGVVASFCSRYLGKTMLTLDEVYSSRAGGALHFSDIECAQYALLKGSKLAKRNKPSADTVGSVDASSIVLCYAHQYGIQSSKSGSGKLTSAQHSSVFKTNGSLQYLLIHHRLTDELRGVRAGFLDVKMSAQSSLLLYMSGLLETVMQSVRNKPKRIASGSNAPNRFLVPSSEADKSVSNAGGYYKISGTTLFREFSNGVSMQIVDATPTQGQKFQTTKFLVWTFADDGGHADDAEHTISRVTSIATKTQSFSFAILKSASTVRFSGDTNPLFLQQWPSDSVTLTDSIRNHGGLVRGTADSIDRFRIMASKLIGSLMSVNECGVILRCLSPAHVLLGEDSIKLVTLPVTVESNDVPHDDANIMESYKSCLLQAKDFLSLACLPPASTADQENLSSKFDVWSLGVCLLVMAFGIPVEDVLTKVASLGFDEDRSNSGHVAAALLLGGPVSKLLSSAHISSVLNNFGEFTDASSSLLYLLVRELVNASGGASSKMRDLFKFRSIFLSSSSNVGLSETSAAALWERFIQSIFVQCKGGAASLSGVRDEFVTLCCGVEVRESSALRQLFETKYSFTCSTAEVDLLICALTPTLSSDATFTDRARKAAVYLGSLIEEVYVYGAIQQIIFTIYRCMTPSLSARPHLQDILQVELLSDLDDSSASRALSQFSAALQKFDSAEQLVESVVVSPLRKIYSDLLRFDYSSSRDDLFWSMTLDRFSSTLAIFEELISMYTAKALEQEYKFTDILNIDGASSKWIFEEASNIAIALTAKNIYTIFSSFALKYFRQYQSAVSGNNDFDALSIGSKLIARLSRTIEHSIRCVEMLSRHSQITASDMYKSFKQYDPTDSGASVNVACVCNERTILESLYFGVVAGVNMLFMGSEAPLMLPGSCGDTLASLITIFPDRDDADTLLKDVFDSTPAVISASAQISKMFEQHLTSLVGDDGAGTSSKIRCSKDCLIFLDSLTHSNMGRG